LVPLLLYYSSIFCQSTKLKFQSIRQGLSNQYVRCILKDSQGFIWFGTQNGLTRYDGVNFVVYENIPGDTNSLCYNNISYLYEDVSKNLWVGTFIGLNLYNREKNNFNRINQLQSTSVSSICEDKDKNIWIGSIGSRLTKYNLQKNKAENFTSAHIDITTINSNHITGLLVDNKNRLWIGSWNGLCLMDTKGKIIQSFQTIPNDPESLSDNFINTLSIEKDSVLWIGTIYGGLNKLIINDKKFRFKHFKIVNDNKPSSILYTFADKHNILWIGTENNGLLQFNTNLGTVGQYLYEEGNPYTLSSNLIRSVYIDDLNILWVGTIGRGVNINDERRNRFESYRKNPYASKTLCGDGVRCFAEDKNGLIWIATYDGICTFNIKTKQFNKVLSQEKGNLTTNAINFMVFDSEGNLWVGTLDKGIDCFNNNLVKIGNFRIKGIRQGVGNKINTLYIDKRDNLWVGTSGSGLLKYDKLHKTFNQISDEANGIHPWDLGYVFPILETSDHSIWVGTAYGLFCITESGNNKYAIKVFNSSNSPGKIHSNYITSLFEDQNKNLWLGSLDQGLFLYNKRRNSFISFTKKDGLPGNSVLGILNDDFGNLWISSDKGISKFKISSKKFTNYTKKDGLVSDEYNGNSCLRSSDGMLLFGSNEGFSCFYPEKIKNNTSVQKVLLTDFKLFNESVPIGTKNSPLKKCISETHKITLKYYQSMFIINFVALNYIQGSKSKYAYILEGLENKWNIVENKNSAAYNYVKPGKYLFKVKGSNNDGIWNNTPTVLEIVILPPIWETIWAYSLYILIVIYIIFAIIRFRVARVKQIHLAELNQMKLQFFANISHELRTPLSLIISPIENILAFAKENKEITRQLELIYKNSNRLFRLVNEIMDFSKATESKLTISVQYADIVKFIKELSLFFSDEASRRQIIYTFESEPSSIEAWFDRDKFEKIILNLLSNAFKFTPDNGTINIKIEKLGSNSIQLKQKEYNKTILSSKELLKISIIDNGKWISPVDINKIFNRFYQGNNEDYTYQTGTGIGLSLTKTLVELHHGNISATSEKGKETCFTILMPLGNNHFKKEEIIMEPFEIRSNMNYEPMAPIELNKEIKIPQNAPTILLVEDNFELRKYIVSTLSSKYKIIEAGDGESGYKLATENVPDLIISDIIMPVLSGIELCNQLKGNIITSHIPIILLTAKFTLQDKIIGIETGADAYITKPFNVRYLEVVAKNLIESRKKLFQRFSQDVYIMPKEMSNNKLDQNFLENVINYIEDNITSGEFSVDDLSSHLLMSSGHVWRKVKALTGLPTNEFIRTIRLKSAIKIMEEGNLNISEIAFKVGFSSPAYFTKCFREQYGKSPSAYISNKKGK
jgi:ligand-binding sensor domain-containing protein/signal transduction histidine kinase/DNA-binding response OmpR family regulator